MGYNLLINGVYWGYNPLTNLLLTSWAIQVLGDISKFTEKHHETMPNKKHQMMILRYLTYDSGYSYVCCLESGTSSSSNGPQNCSLTPCNDFKENTQPITHLRQNGQRKCKRSWVTMSPNGSRLVPKQAHGHMVIFSFHMQTCPSCAPSTLAPLAPPHKKKKQPTKS